MDDEGEGWSRRIDGYCERTGPGFWDEPLNAVTNAAFVIAALVAFVIARRQGRLDGPVIFLIANLAIIGLGSFLFHTFATRWAAVMDTTPILVFILAYFAIAMARYVGLSATGAAVATLILLAEFLIHATAFRTLLYDTVGGSVSYFPALLMLFAVGLWLRAVRGHPAGLPLVAGGLLFAVSLTFRALDEPLCPDWPIGTHFLWHLCNGLLLGWLIVTMIRHGRPTGARA